MKQLCCLICKLIVLCVAIAISQQQCESDITIKMGATSNDIYKQIVTYYAVNASVYGKTINFKYDNSQVQTSNGEVVAKLKSRGLALAVAEDPPVKSDPTFVFIPVMAGALIFYINLPNITNLILSPQVIADIYRGHVVLWNDTMIQDLNPQLTLPGKKIAVSAEYAENAGTDLLGWSLSIYSNIWKQQFEGLRWQKVMNCTYTSTASDMLKYISKTQYSIGFTALENIIAFSTGSVNPQTLTNLTILNSNGFPVHMTTKNIAATLKSLPPETYSNLDLLAYLIKNSGSTTYPFVYFEYLVVNRTVGPYSNISCCTLVEALGYIDYTLDFVRNTTWTKYGFFNIPAEWVQYVRANVFPMITCNGSSTYSDLLQSRGIFSSQAPAVESWKIIVPIAVTLVVLTVTIIGGLTFYQKHIMLYRQDLWKINESEINFFQSSSNEIGLSTLVMNTIQASDAALENLTSIKNNMTKIGKFKRNEVEVCLTALKLANFLNWQQTINRLIYKFTRDFNHPNLCPLFGVTTIQSKPYLVSQYCHKGTLNHVLEHCPYELLLDIKYSLANNVLNGLKYLHSKLIIHSSLNSMTCYVDESWCVKIMDWALFSIKSKAAVKPTLLNDKNASVYITNTDKPDSKSDLVRSLYTDPNDVHPNQPTKLYDIYSFGMILMEIFTRQLPFNEEVENGEITYAEILRKKQRKVECIPQMTTEVPNEIRPLIRKMIGPSESRPDIISVAIEIAKVCGNSNKNVVDVMMKLMEKHMEDLEEKVIERTSELSSITHRMKDLLNEILPPQIAEKFIAGVNVEPEFYECATILFSDIVGFSTISARSTPYQVMNLLNDLWKLFDATIEKFNVYKADTIGDVYMVSSGLPDRNGMDHCREVANFALFLLNETKTFAIPHLTGETILCRMGINSGPVTTGIIGHKMPQYCVFGDTVNTASRMESSSLPLRIHVSELSHSLFEKNFPEFIFELRGEIEVKGKGKMKTYWLVDSFKCTI